jgi:hypothetical protein
VCNHPGLLMAITAGPLPQGTSGTGLAAAGWHDNGLKALLDACLLCTGFTGSHMDPSRDPRPYYFLHVIAKPTTTFYTTLAS